MFPSLLLLFVAGTPAASEAGTATIPVERLLKYEQASPEAAEPPVAALVGDAELVGRILPGYLAVGVRIPVTVLADGQWTQVKLLELDDAYVERLTPLSEASVGVGGGVLSLLAQKSGVYTVEATVRVPHRLEGGRIVARLRLGPGLPAVPLQLEASARHGVATTRLIHPVDSLLTVEWQAPARSAPVPVAKAAAPVEAKISVAEAVWVSTLEGRLSLDVEYRVELDRQEVITFTLPDRQRLERVTVNGIAIQHEVSSGTLSVGVAPADVDGRQAQVRLRLREELGVFHLSGALSLAMPKVSLPASQVFARVHLPNVFNYRRSGGSLEPGTAREYTIKDHQPLPGKTMFFRQFLVGASAPTIDLGYSVDLDGRYFRGG